MDNAHCSKCTAFVMFEYIKAAPRDHEKEEEGNANKKKTSKVKMKRLSLNNYYCFAHKALLLEYNKYRTWKI